MFRDMPYARIILGPRYVVRLSQIEATDCLFARCLSCDRRWKIAPHRMHDRWPAYTRLVEIAREMRCPCGARGEGIAWNVLRASCER
jgi:hypothetical protein